MSLANRRASEKPASPLASFLIAVLLMVKIWKLDYNSKKKYLQALDSKFIVDILI